jgi:protein-S-isoprenylcysteine O-methyltransferase Ste14
MAVIKEPRINEAEAIFLTGVNLAIVFKLRLLISVKKSSMKKLIASIGVLLQKAALLLLFF